MRLNSTFVALYPSDKDRYFRIDPDGVLPSRVAHLPYPAKRVRIGYFNCICSCRHFHRSLPIKRR
ncbi:MAG: hypothetical protein RL090_1210, partial [Bacteroidota bacterium]